MGEALLCISLLGGALLARLPGPTFTLAWTHSVEKIEWQEDWRVTRDGLAIEEARVRGNGAGMEIPDGARLAGGWWRYRPPLDPVEALTLANSTFTADYRLCSEGGCRPLGEITGRVDSPVSLMPCR
jgi:hypothetical protein